MTGASGGRSFVALLDERDRNEFERLGRVRRVRAGAHLVSEGDRSDHVLLILEGRVKVFCTTAEGREPLLAMRGPGELLGELAALEGGSELRTATVAAMEPVVAREISGREFRDFVFSHPAVAQSLVRMLIGRLRRSDRRIVEYGGYDSPHRLARLIVQMVEEHGVPEGDGASLDVRLSQEELASMIGASRESVARALTRLRSQGLVETRRRGLTVPDIERLRQHCQ